MVSNTSGVPPRGSLNFSPKEYLQKSSIDLNNDVSFSGRLKMHGSSVRIDDLLKESRISRARNSNWSAVNTSSASCGNCTFDKVLLEPLDNEINDTSVDSIPITIEAGFERASIHPTSSLNKIASGLSDEKMPVSPLKLQKDGSDLGVSSSPYSPPENVHTPTTGPEIPPEIPHISNLRGGRGLFQRFITESYSEPPAIIVPEPPCTPPSATSNHSNPYSTPDPTPKNKLVAQHHPIRNKNLTISHAMNAMKTTCGICLDNGLITLNGTLLECGDYVHRSCLAQARFDLSSSNMIPICGICGNECITKSLASESSSSSFIDSFTLSTVEPLRLQNDQESLSNGSEYLRTDPRIESLHVKAFIHKVSERKCELAIRIECDPFSEKNRNGFMDYDNQDLTELSYEALSLLPHFSTPDEAAQNCGNICLISSFSDKDYGSINGYLFENCIILAGITHDGTEVLHKFYDLQSESLTIHSDVEGLCIRELEKISYHQHNIKATTKTISSWISTINGMKLTRPHSHFFSAESEKLQPSPFSSEFLDLNSIEVIFCVSLDLLKYTLTNVLGEMNLQDRLGLVVISKSGTVKTLKPHKPSWNWDNINEDSFNDNEYFELTDQPTITAAECLLSPKTPGKQQAIILTEHSGITHSCIPTNKSVSYYSVNYKEYSLSMEELSKIDIHSIRCYVASSSSEIMEIIKGIFICERNYRYEDVKIKIEPFSFGNIDNIGALQPQTSRQLDFNGCEISVGKLLAGQYSTALFEIDLSEDVSQLLNLRDLVYCTVTTKSTTSFRPFNLEHIHVQEISSPHTPQIFFDRMVRRLAEKLLTYRNFGSQKIKHEIHELSEATIQEVQSAVNSFKFGKIDRFSSLFGEFVLDFDPVFSDEAMNRRAKYLAWGLCQFARDINNTPDNSNVIILRLLELLQTLDSYRTVICRNDAERIFFEALPVNRI